MDTLSLRNGDPLPAIGLGTWQLSRDTAGTVAEALELGYRLIDTSGDYGTEAGVGDGIRRSGVRREDVFLVTKVEEDEDAYESTRERLSDLGMEYADLVLVHRPPENGVGQHLWEGLQRARDEGLVRHIGVSNYSVAQLKELAEAGEMPEVNQVEWSPFGWSKEMLDFCRKNQILLQAWSPLTRVERLNDRRITDIASAHRRTPAQVVLRWDIQRGVVPLPKANRREHLEENLNVFDFQLYDDELSVLDGLNEGWSSLGPSLQYT